MTYEYIAANIEAKKYEMAGPYPPAGEARERYRKLNAEKQGQFAADCRALMSTQTAPAVLIDLLYGKAWEDGHSAGFHEVLIYCQDYADILAEAFPD